MGPATSTACATWSQLQREFQEETNGTNMVQNDRATFVKFAYSCHLYRNSGVHDSKPLRLTVNAQQ
jgi:hypothetical protein